MSVGQLAPDTKSTVRTLHHQDRIGLVSPSGRTPAGHRVYDDADVRRLYRVVALRQWGPALDRIRAVSDGDLDIVDLLAAHEHALVERIEMSALRARVATTGFPSHPRAQP